MFLSAPSPTIAAPTLEGLIRDAEIEETLQSYLKQLARAADLQNMSLRGYVLADPSLNAFATLNASIFMHSGLILEAPSLEALLGVMAHELGHIKCGHLARRGEALQKAGYGVLTGVLMGALVGVGTGRGDVGTSLAIAGAQYAQHHFLVFSQGEESAADQAAIDYLTKLRWPLQGLEDFLTFLQARQGRREEMAGILTTHPPTPERLEHVRYAVNLQKKSYQRFSLESLFYQRYQRMLAKLRGFLTSPEYVLLATETSLSFEDAYARAIALFRLGRIQESLRLLDTLLSQEPHNPFLHEIKGQFLLNEGHIERAISSYKEAVRIHPVALLKLGYAQALLASENDQNLDTIQKLLEEVRKTEKEIPFVWQGLSIIYGKQGKMGACQLALAERALLMKDVKTALRCAEKAKKLSPPHSQEALRAEDMIQGLKDPQKKK